MKQHAIEYGAGCNRPRKSAFLLALMLAAMPVGGAQSATPRQAAKVKATPAPAATATPVAAIKSSSWTLDGYKKDAAQWIYGANQKNLFADAPPSVLKSVVVLSIAIDAEGRSSRVTVLRSNGYHELDQLAIRSVQRASPLPQPSRMIVRGTGPGAGVQYTETWLFRDDGRFQIRSLAQAQATGLQD